MKKVGAKINNLTNVFQLLTVNKHGFVGIDSMFKM